MDKLIIGKAILVRYTLSLMKVQFMEQKLLLAKMDITWLVGQFVSYTRALLQI